MRILMFFFFFLFFQVNIYFYLPHYREGTKYPVQRQLTDLHNRAEEHFHRYYISFERPFHNPVPVCKMVIRHVDYLFRQKKPIQRDKVMSKDHCSLSNACDRPPYDFPWILLVHRNHSYRYPKNTTRHMIYYNRLNFTIKCYYPTTKPSHPTS